VVLGVLLILFGGMCLFLSLTHYRRDRTSDGPPPPREFGFPVRRLRYESARQWKRLVAIGAICVVLGIALVLSR
jgi:hypothetical protein